MNPQEHPCCLASATGGSSSSAEGSTPLRTGHFFQRLHLQQYKPQWDPALSFGSSVSPQLCWKPSRDTTLSKPAPPVICYCHQLPVRSRFLRGQGHQPVAAGWSVPGLTLSSSTAAKHNRFFFTAEKDLKSLALGKSREWERANKFTVANTRKQIPYYSRGGSSAQSCNKAVYKTASFSMMFDKWNLLKHGCTKLQHPLVQHFGSKGDDYKQIQNCLSASLCSFETTPWPWSRHSLAACLAAAGLVLFTAPHHHLDTPKASPQARIHLRSSHNAHGRCTLEYHQHRGHRSSDTSAGVATPDKREVKKEWVPVFKRKIYLTSFT